MFEPTIGLISPFPPLPAIPEFKPASIPALPAPPPPPPIPPIPFLVNRLCAPIPPAFPCAGFAETAPGLVPGKPLSIRPPPPDPPVLGKESYEEPPPPPRAIKEPAVQITEEFVPFPPVEEVATPPFPTDMA